MKKASIYLALAFGGAMSLGSCIDKDLYRGTAQEEKEKLSGFEYSDRFANFAVYYAKINSNVEGGRMYSVYTEYPYDSDGQLVLDPILYGLTPIGGEISVPNGTKALYVVNDGGVRAYPVGNLEIDDDNSTRAESETATPGELLNAKTMINNHLLPEKKYNMYNENLYQCTDLVIDGLEENQVARVWLTYIGDGGSGISGKAWYYKYNVDNPTLDDCTFYGEGGKEVTFADIQAKKKPFATTAANTLDKEMEVNVKLENGDRLGFVYLGNKALRFSTPSLNNADVCGFDYINKTVPYTTGDFTIEQNVACGAIMHFTCGGKEYNVVGMENSLPGESSYDGDYNDMLFLIRSNPETIAPGYELPLPELVFKTIRTGVWIFEDTYPESGDFDFNDVVVFYQIETCEGMMDVTCWLAATGCSYSNEIGLLVLKNKDSWQTPVQKEVVWTGITGYRNVSDGPVDLDNLPCKKVRLTCSKYDLLRPYLDNGHGPCTPEHYNTSNYPYCLDLPSSTGTRNTWFRWPIEGHNLDLAYYFLAGPDGGERQEDWFLNGRIKDASHVVKRTVDQVFPAQTTK